MKKIGVRKISNNNPIQKCSTSTSAEPYTVTRMKAKTIIAKTSSTIMVSQ
jgi:hypothetical protein